MAGSCDAGGAVIGPVIAFLGAVTLGLGILAWVRPDSPLIRAITAGRTSAGSASAPRQPLGGPTSARQHASLRFGWMLIGAVWLLMGAYGSNQALRCAGLPALVPLSLRVWPPMFGFIAFALLIGVIGAWRADPRDRAIVLVGTLVFAIAGTQAAAFHTGIMAAEWGAIAFLSLFVTGAVTAIERMRRQ
jgi:hypothetical protein